MITLDQAAEQLLLRRNARRDLVSWAKLCGYIPARHHLFLLERLQRIVTEKGKRLMVFMPPRSAKSTYCSVIFPPWFLGQMPNSTILCCSHSADLAESFGRRARNLIATEALALGYNLAGDSRAAGEWATTNGGTFFCAGVEGTVTGRGAHLGLIDDPVASKADAYSKKKRDSAWDWYNFDFRTRLEPQASVILIMTRWHDDDLAGRLLKEEKGEWEVIRLPRFAEVDDPLGRAPGESLWPERFDETSNRDARKDPVAFAALHQQRPTLEDGDYFEKKWIVDNAYDKDELPALSDLTLYQAGDLAVSEEQRNDASAVGTAGLDSRGVLWILPDLVWDRLDAGNLVNVIVNLMAKHNPKYWWGEKGQIQKSLGPFLKTAMRDRGIYTFIQPFACAHDKPTRAQSIRGMFQIGCVRLPRFASWYEDALDQLLRFPGGTHDDVVDFLSLLGLGLEKMIAARPKIEDQGQDAPPIHWRPTYRWLREEQNRLEQNDQLILLDR